MRRSCMSACVRWCHEFDELTARDDRSPARARISAPGARASVGAVAPSTSRDRLRGTAYQPHRSRARGRFRHFTIASPSHRRRPRPAPGSPAATNHRPPIDATRGSSTEPSSQPGITPPQPSPRTTAGPVTRRCSCGATIFASSPSMAEVLATATTRFTTAAPTSRRCAKTMAVSSPTVAIAASPSSSRPSFAATES